MPDRSSALEPGQFFLAENLRDEPHVAMEQKRRARSVGSDDAGALLPAMLQGKETVVRQDSRVRMTEHAEDAAFMHRIRRQRWRRKLFLNHRSGKDTHSVANVTFSTAK